MPKGKKTNKEIDSGEDKHRRIAIEIESLHYNEIVTPTNLARKIKIHVNKLKDELNKFESLKNIGFAILRDKNRNIRGILRTDESLNFRKDVRAMQKDILEIKNALDEIKTKILLR